jgi:serine/threonine protein kinase/formylglycine-generating enzyme required for sulfatase activity
VNDPSQPAKPNDPRVAAAMREFHERINHGEPVDREEFIARHAEIADEIRPLIAAAAGVERISTADPRTEASAVSTGSFNRQNQETLLPDSSARRASDSSPGGISKQFGRYCILRVLGQGAMGTVYLAEDTQLQRQVALKTPQFTDDSAQESLERFYREARTAATLRHPNICPVHDVGEIEGTHYISMAYIEGLPLSDLIQPERRQTERQILNEIRKLAQALQEAHDHDIVHRDLKPANVMIDKRGEPLIMDFGLARQVRREQGIRLTQSGVLLGSPAYMSPEQVEGDAALVGPASDQYSLGVILYELLTGELPFQGSLAAVLGQIVSREPTPPSRLRAGLDPRVEAICLKMLAKKPSDRFASLSAVADELTLVLRTPAAMLTPAEESASSEAILPVVRLSTSNSVPSMVGASKVLAASTQRANKMPQELAADRVSDRTRIDGGWFSWRAVALGLAFLGLLLFGVTIFVRSGKAVLKVEIDDPNMEVALKGTTLVLKSPEQEIKVEPGETELTITYHDLKFTTPSFRLEKGNNQLVKVSLVDSKMVARLGDKNLPLTPAQSLPIQKATPPQAAIKTSEAKTEKIAATAAGVPALLAMPFDAAQAKKARDEWSRHLKIPAEMTNSIGMKLILVPPGEFVMGPYQGHRVRITHAMYVGVYEVTRAQFAKFIAETGFKTDAEFQKGGTTLDNAEKPVKWDPERPYTWRDPGFPQEDNHPAVQLTWDDATAFCDWLGRKEGKSYRLPTEAEWEYDCRAGTWTRIYNSSDLEEGTKIGNIADVTIKAIYPRWDRGVKTSDGFAYTSPVGHFIPNNFGLYDMIGNVSEWCSDWYDKDYYQHAPEENPPGPSAGTQHVGRGGGFSDVPGSRYRYYGNVHFRRPDWGLRVACDVAAPKK